MQIPDLQRPSALLDHTASLKVAFRPYSLGYSFTGHCRSGRKGGGIAVIHRSPILFTKITEGEKTSFEFAEYIVISGSDKLRLVVVYRIPYSPTHPIGVSTFLDEFADYLESTPGDLVTS